MPIRRPHRTVRRPVPRQHTVRPLVPVPEPDAEIQTEAEAEIEARPVAKPPAARARRADGPSRRLVVALAAFLVLALGGLVWAATQWYEGDRLAAAHQAALAAAKQATVDFVAISAETVDRDLQRIAEAATGDFADEFARGMPQVRQAVVENKVHSSGAVLRAGLVSGDLDSAVVLVAIDASVKNTGAPEGRLSHYRIQVDLVLDPDSGRWLVSRLQFVG